MAFCRISQRGEQLAAPARGEKHHGGAAQQRLPRRGALTQLRGVKKGLACLHHRHRALPTLKQLARAKLLQRDPVLAALAPERMVACAAEL